MKNRGKTKNTFCLHLLHPRLNFIPSFLHSWLFYLLFHQQLVQEDGEWGLWSVHKSSCLPLLPPHTFLLLQFGSFSCDEVLQEVLQHGSLPWNVVLQEWSAPAWIAYGLQFLTDILFLSGFCQSCSFLQGLSTCSSMGTPMACSVDICFTEVLNELKGTTCFTTIFSTGDTPVPAPGAPFPPSSSLTWTAAFMFLSYFCHDSLTAAAQHFCPFLNMLSERCHQHH